MRRVGGFSLLEVMLALVVVAIGIGVVLTFSTSHQQQTGSASIGNDYATIVNETLKQFTTDIEYCNDNRPVGDCSLTSISSKNLYDYLCQNPDGMETVTVTDSTCSNARIASAQYTKLQQAGIDLLRTTIAITPSHSDV